MILKYSDDYFPNPRIKIDIFYESIIFSDCFIKVPTYFVWSVVELE